VASFSDLAFDASIAARSLADSLIGLAQPRLRLGVTGLSRSGKTVFITALVHALTRGARMPVFRAWHEGRVRRAVLEPQPDDAVPRFAYEDHVGALLAGSDRHWPESTRRIAELRVAVDFESKAAWRSGPRSLTLDIVDYPGEWLLDLGLLGKSYAEWSRETVAACRQPARRPASEPFLSLLQDLDPGATAKEDQAREAAERFRTSLRAARTEPFAFSALPPGRFLMPGDLEGSPALTFAPLDITPDTAIPPGSLAAMMERRYEAYLNHVVRPFFRDHFARLDRQIVLADLLSALNAGPAAVADLEKALDDVLLAFRTGRNSLLSSLLKPRIDRVLFAATKADHLHHTSHDRLESVLRLLVDRSLRRAESFGAQVDVIALASVRATREAMVREGRETLEAIVGTPIDGEAIDGETFDGLAEAAVFPGELPADPAEALAQAGRESFGVRFVRFRPPMVREHNGKPPQLPHIRMDRAFEFLFGDRLA
jgi:predicted YcjX-like family ATPase